MLFKEIFRVIGFFLYFFALALVVPLGIGLYYELYADPSLHPHPNVNGSFLISIVIVLVLALLFSYIGRKAKGYIYRREGIATVVIIWFIIPALGALPFLISGTLKNPLQAYFEITSGFTTTGASILAAKKYDPVTHQEIPIQVIAEDVVPVHYSFYGTVDPVRDKKTNAIIYEGIEAVSPALLFWRSMTQWLGGGGIIVLFVAILPALGVGGKMLFHTEVTGPIKDSLTPRIKETAIQLWKIYCILTISQILMLMFTNPQIHLFDAIATTFSTISTGGFSVKNQSIASYNNANTEWVVALFMILGGINFSLYYYALKGKIYRLYEVELGLYLLAIIFLSLLSTHAMIGTPDTSMQNEVTGTFDTSKAFRQATFMQISALTSTGFIVGNYDYWPIIVQVLMLVAMFIGGMSGSTSGGIKIIRHYILFRLAQFKTESLFEPEAVRTFKIGDREVGPGGGMMVLAFFCIVIAVSVIATVVFVMDGIDSQTALGLTACLVNNAGVGFQAAGATKSFAFLSNFSLALSSFLMILGRLEFFAVLSLLIPAFWRQNY